MGKCASCGEWNPDKNDFCSACGSPLPHGNPLEAENAMEEARKQFERDSLVSLERSRITYVCEICGTVNSIDNRACSKCGKPRPRSEMVTALRRIKQSEQLKNEPPEPEEEPQVVAAVVEEQQPAPAPEPVEQVPAQPALTLFRYEGGVFPGLASQQQAPVMQPFVVVPYVNQFQPLYQYVPGGQLMRFEPAAQVQAPAPAEPQREQQGAQEAVVREVVKPKKQKGIRFANLVALALSAAAIVIVFLLALVNGIGVRSPLFEGIPALLDKFFGLSLSDGSYVLSSWVDYLAPIGLALGVLFSFLVVLTCLIEMIRNHWTGAATAFAVIAFAGTYTGTMGMLQSVGGLASFSALLNAARYPLFALWGVTVAAVAVTAIVQGSVNAFCKKSKLVIPAEPKEENAQAA